MAARNEGYAVVEDEKGHILGLYIAKTPQQALVEHTKPLAAKMISVADAQELMFGEHGFRPVRCSKVGL